MKTIAYYISDYGYGHASRSIAVIRKLLQESGVRIIVCHSFALSFIKASILSDRVSYRSIKTDVGYFLEKDSIYPDRRLLFSEYQQFLSNWDDRIKQEQKFLKFHHVDLVISDISPLPFEAAYNLDIPSIGLSNFTWYTAYQGLVDEKGLKPFKDAYGKMTYFFSLAGSQENWEVETSHFGFFSREKDVKETKRIRQTLNPSNDKSIVFVGLGMKIGVDSLEKLPIWDRPNTVFIVSSNVNVSRENVYRIPADYLESQNFIAASDLVISKAGWGMIGEAVGASVPLLILNRSTMREDQNTISYLKQRQLCETVEWDEFKTLTLSNSNIKVLQKVIKEKPYYLHDMAEKVALKITGILKESRQGSSEVTLPPFDFFI